MDDFGNDILDGDLKETGKETYYKNSIYFVHYGN